MKKYLFICLAIIIAVFLISCDDSTSKKSGITPITPAETETETTYIIKATVEGCTSEYEHLNRTVYVKSIDDLNPDYDPNNIYCIYSDPACTSQLTALGLDMFYVSYNSGEQNFSISPSSVSFSFDTSNTNWTFTVVGEDIKVNIKKGNYSFDLNNIGVGTLLTIEVPKDITNLICEGYS